MPNNIVTLGGREYRAIQNSTLEHDYLTLDRINAADLREVELREGEDVDNFARELLLRLTKSRQLYPLLAHLLTPSHMDDLDWTAEVAEQTAAHLSRLSSPEDKQILQAQVVEMLICFFRDGRTALKVSQNFF